jgi:hypothetical protein
MFEKSQYKVIINNPDTYKNDDTIVKLNIVNYDRNEISNGNNSVFFIIGPFRDR